MDDLLPPILGDDVDVWLITPADKLHPMQPLLRRLGVPFHVYLPKDWQLPHAQPEFDLDRTETELRVAGRRYHRWRDHQEIMRRAAGGHVLVIEPGLVPVAKTRAYLTAAPPAPDDHGMHWLDVVNASAVLTGHDRHDSVILSCEAYGTPDTTRSLMQMDWYTIERQSIPKRLRPRFEFVLPRLTSSRLSFLSGPVAYLMQSGAVAAWAKAEYDGFALPMYLVNTLSAIVASRGLFFHPFEEEVEHETSPVGGSEQVQDPGQ